MNHKELAVKIAHAFTPKVGYARKHGWRPYADTSALFENRDYYLRFIEKWKSLNVKYKQRFYIDKASPEMTLILIEQALEMTEHDEE